MTPEEQPNDSRALAVAVGPVQDGWRGRGPKLAAVALVVIAVGLVGVGIAGRIEVATTATTSTAPAAITPSPAAVVPSNPPLAGVPDDAEVRIPSLSSEALAGAPILAMWRRDGSDAVVVRWDPAHPEAGLVEHERIVGLLRDIPADADLLVALSPRARLVAASAFTSSPDGDDVERVRVSTLGGKEVWQLTFHDSAISAPAWNPVRDQLVVPGRQRWRVVSFASGTARVRSIPVPTFDREPHGGLTSNPIAPAIVGFSPNGHVAYAAASDSPFLLGLRPLFEVDLAAGRAHEIDRLPGRLADMASSGGSADLARVDPGSGRVFGPPGPGGGAVTVYGRDGATVTSRLGGARILGVAWASDGRLAILRTDPSADPANAAATTVQLADGTDGTSRSSEVLATTRVTDGALLAAPDGYVLAVLAADEQYELVAIRPADGRAATMIMPTETLASLRFLGWLPRS